MSKYFLTLILSLIVSSSIYASPGFPIPDLTSSKAPASDPQSQTVFMLPHTFDDGSDLATFDDIAKSITSVHNTHILFIDAGYGGYAMQGLLFTRAMQQSEAQGNTITVEVLTQAYSMHAVVACYATNVIIDDGSTLMFHGQAAEGSVLGIIPYDDMSAVTTQLSNDAVSRQCIRVGLLTQEDADNINKGYDVYVAAVGNKIVKITESDPTRYRSVPMRFIGILFDYFYKMLLVCSILYAVAYTITRAIRNGKK